MLLSCVVVCGHSPSWHLASSYSLSGLLYLCPWLLCYLVLGIPWKLEVFYHSPFVLRPTYHGVDFICRAFSPFRCIVFLSLRVPPPTNSEVTMATNSKEAAVVNLATKYQELALPMMLAGACAYSIYTRLCSAPRPADHTHTHTQATQWQSEQITIFTTRRTKRA